MAAPSVIERIRRWWRRTVIVRRAVPDSDVAYIFVGYQDPDGTVTDTPSESLYCSRNNLFALAWVCREWLEMEKEKGPASKVSLTLQTPIRGGEEETHVLDVPDWAKNKLFQRIIHLAVEFGWQGECPKPETHGAFR